MDSEDLKKMVSMVDMIYIDPPYNTKNVFSYEDNKERSKWIKFMKDRLFIAKNYGAWCWLFVIPYSIWAIWKDISIDHYVQVQWEETHKEERWYNDEYKNKHLRK